MIFGRIGHLRRRGGRGWTEAHGPVHAFIIERRGEHLVAKSICGRVEAAKHDFAEKWSIGFRRVLRVERREAFKEKWDGTCKYCEKKYADMVVVDALMGERA